METSDAAYKAKRWLKDPASQKQIELLQRAGYQIGAMDFSFTKYAAAAHLNFQWNRHEIERTLFSHAA